MAVEEGNTIGAGTAGWRLEPVRVRLLGGFRVSVEFGNRTVG